MHAKRSRSNKRGSTLEQVIAGRMAELAAKFQREVEVAPQHRVLLTSGRKTIIDFRLQVEFAHEVQNYYIEVQSRDKHDHELMDKIEAVRRDTALKTFRFVHDTPIEQAVAKELRSRGVICYDLAGFDTFLKGIELNLAAVNRLQEQASGKDGSVDTKLKALVDEIANVDKDIAHINRVPNPRKDRLVEDAIELAARNPDAVVRMIKGFFGGR